MGTQFRLERRPAVLPYFPASEADGKAIVFEVVTGFWHGRFCSLGGSPISSQSSPITLVLGGARSGKSRYAESLIARHPAPWIYVATAQAFDDEMRVRIAEHRARRGGDWQTTEAPIDLADAVDREPVRPVLVDCLTLWLSNLMLGGYDLSAGISGLEAALDRRQAPTVLVSNEVGLGIVPETPLGRSFRDEAGRLNQRLAKRARHVLFMIAGLPMTLK